MYPPMGHQTITRRPLKGAPNIAARLFNPLAVRGKCYALYYKSVFMFQLPYLVSMRVNSNISVQPLSERELYLILHWLPLMPGMLLSNKYQPRRVFHNVSPYNPGGVELINETTSMEQIYITYLPYGYTYTYTYGYTLIYITLALWLYPVVNCWCPF